MKIDFNRVWAIASLLTLGLSGAAHAQGTTTWEDTVVYVAANGTGKLLETTSTNGVNWTSSYALNGQTTKFAPAMADTSDGDLVAAYVASNGSNDLFTTLETGWEEWSSSYPVTEGSSKTVQSSKTAPALADFTNDELFLAYVANNSSDDLLVTSSVDGINWSNPSLVGGQSSSMAPALADLGGELVMAYVANNGSNDLLTTLSSNGTSWTSSYLVGGQSSRATPALAAFYNELVMVYVANNGSNQLYVTTSTDGIHWTTSTAITGQFSDTAPSLAVTGNANGTYSLVLTYVSTNGSDDLLVTTSTNGVNWTTSTPISNQSTTIAPALNVTGSYNP